MTTSRSNSLAVVLRIANRRGFDWVVAAVPAVLGVWLLGGVFRCIDQVALRGAETGLASICGTIAGFLTASLLFSAGVDNRSVKKVRVRFGAELNATLLGGTATLFASALACLGASVAPSSLVSRGVVLAVLALVVAKLARVMILLAGVLASVNDAASDAG